MAKACLTRRAAALPQTVENALKQAVAPPAAPAAEKKSGFHWWWGVPILALFGLLGLLPRLFRKKSVVGPVQRLVEHPVATVREKVHEVTTDLHQADVEYKTRPVVAYETQTPTGNTVEVIYANNALGANFESRADRSDPIRD